MVRIEHSPNSTGYVWFVDRVSGGSSKTIGSFKTEDEAKAFVATHEQSSTVQLDAPYISDLETAARAALAKEMRRNELSRTEQLTFLLGFSAGSLFGFERAERAVMAV